MEPILFDKIQSKYILKLILGYIKDKKDILKLFMHSKVFQNKLGIKLIDYQKIFLSRFFLENYLNYNALYDDFDKYSLKNNFKNDLLQYKLNDNNIINNKEYLIYYFKNYYEKINEEELNCNRNPLILIDIFSPFFEVLSKTEIFSELFSIIILPRYIISKQNLKNEYINTFDQLDKINSKYSSIAVHCEDKEDFNIINDLGINFHNIKSLILFIINYHNNFSFIFNDKAININKLIKLSIDSKLAKSIEIESKSFENINNLNLLEELQLSNLFFKDNFTIKLYNLKKLYITYCKNISFSEDKPYDIEILELNYCIIIEPKDLLKFPKLKKYYINNIFNRCGWNLSFLDLINIPNHLNIEISKFSDIDKNLPIEYLKINYGDLYKEVNQKIIETIISMKTLKYFHTSLFNISDDDILKIQGENTSIKEASILWLDSDDCILFNLQKKIPNLRNLDIKISDMEQGWNQNYVSSIEIVENPNSKVNQFKINSFLGMNIKFYVQSFENLISVDFNINMRFVINKNNFPIFNDECKIVFKSLKSFTLIANNVYSMDFQILNNIYINIDKMPNLKSFVLQCNQEDITILFLIKFIKKILSMKLYNIHLCLTNENFFHEKKHEQYSLNELKKINPQIDVNNFKHIYIRKYKNTNL